MLVSMKSELKDAFNNHKAIYQFNINNLEWIKYILEECNEMRKPVILGVSSSAAKYMCGYKNVCDMVTNLIDNLNITIPVSIHLDHASDLEECKKAIDAGFTSIMIDYSSASAIRLSTYVASATSMKPSPFTSAVGYSEASPSSAITFRI